MEVKLHIPLIAHTFLVLKKSFMACTPSDQKLRREWYKQQLQQYSLSLYLTFHQPPTEVGIRTIFNRSNQQLGLVFICFGDAGETKL